MPIQLSNPPKDALPAVTNALASISTAPTKAAQKINQSEAVKLRMALPHPVFQLGLTDIVEGVNLERAQFIGWRFLVLDGERTLGAIEFLDRQGTLEFLQFETGPHAQATRVAVSTLEDDPRVRDGAYELRLLRAPGVYVMALWLKADSGNADIIVPLSDKERFSQVGGGAGADGFLQSLKPMAGQSLRFQDQLVAGGGGAPPDLPPPLPVVPAPQSPTVPPAAPETPAAAPGAVNCVPAINRMRFIKNYAAMVARTWVDPSYLELLRSDPVKTLAQAGIPTVSGAEVVVVETVITGIGKVEDALEEWIKGNVTGRYLLWIPIKPDNIQFDDGAGGRAKDEGNCCSCCPCCCCT